MAIILCHPFGIIPLPDFHLYSSCSPLSSGLPILPWYWSCYPSLSRFFFPRFECGLSWMWNTWKCGPPWEVVQYIAGIFRYAPQKVRDVWPPPPPTLLGTPSVKKGATLWEKFWFFFLFLFFCYDFDLVFGAWVGSLSRLSPSSSMQQRFWAKFPNNPVIFFAGVP